MLSQTWDKPGDIIADYWFPENCAWESQKN